MENSWLAILGADGWGQFYSNYMNHQCRRESFSKRKRCRDGKTEKREKLKSTLLVLIHFTVQCLPRIQTNHVSQCPDLTLYFLHFWIPKLSLIFFTFSSIHPHLSVPCFSPFIHLHSKYLLIFFTFLNTSLTKIVSALKKQSHLYFFNEFQWIQFNWFNLLQNGAEYQNSFSKYLPIFKDMVWSKMCWYPAHTYYSTRISLYILAV